MDGGRSGRPRFEVKVHKPKNGHDLPREIRATLAGETVIFDVSDKFGIGSGTVRLVEGVWPEKVLVRYHLRGLEGVSVTVGEELLPESELGVRMLNKKGELIKGKYLLKKQGYYESQIPSARLSGGATEVKLHWVDFYRG